LHMSGYSVLLRLHLPDPSLNSNCRLQQTRKMK
jgi:hypothetical protein